MPGNAILEDHIGNLWIGTQKGVSRIVFPDSQSNSGEPVFTNFYNDPENTNSLSHGMVWSIYEDAESNIWVGTNDGTLHKFDRKNENFIRVVTPDRLKEKLGPKWNKLEGDAIVYIGHHPDDPIYILTIVLNGYIYKFDFHLNKIFNQYFKFSELLRKNNLTIINDILIDQNKKIWIATNNGFFIISNDGHQIYDYQWKLRNTSSLSWKHLNTFYEDRQGIIWLGLAGVKRIQKYNPWTQNYKSYIIDTDTSYYVIYSLFEESTKCGSILWVGTSQNGLLKLSRNKNRVESFQGNLQHIITSICQSPFNSNYLWIGTIGRGLIRFDKQKGIYEDIAYRNYIEENKNSGDYSVGEESLIIALLFDRQRQLWIGSLSGLFKFDIQNKITTAYFNEPENINSMSANDISALCESHNNDSVLWIGTRTGGLNKLDLKTGVFTRFQNISNDSLSLNNNYISSILEDKSGTLWVGTPVGLNKLNHTDNTFRSIIDVDRKLCCEIQSIQEDRNSNLWLNTNQGFGKYDQDKNVFQIFSNKFRRWAYFKNSNDEFFYGAGFGIISFFPEKIKYNNYVAPVVLTDFQIFNKSAKVGSPEQSPLQESISETKDIFLSYNQSVFSFEFALLDYSDPFKNKYAYKMEGVDPDWVYTDASRRYATYTQLAPGEYIFRVKGSNNDGLWNEEGTTIKIIITPPWWRTNLAYVFYILLFATVIYTTWRSQLKRVNLKQQLKMEHFEADKLREVDQMKSRFFANISHEFRTPLTLIKGPVKQIMDGEFAGNLKQQCKMILRNSDRLLGLINQILDLSKLESGETKLQVSDTNMVKYLKGLVLSFASLAERKKVSLKFDYGNEEIFGYVDIDKLEKIITNLLSNAIKFTLEGGVVEVMLTEPTPSRFSGHPSKEGNPKQSPLSGGDLGVGKTMVQISISNTGAGIPANQLNKIFDRFYQANDNYKKDGEGTGIELALTKELVEVCHGEISVESEKFVEQTPNLQPPESPFNKGDFITTFTIWLPIEKECFKENEIIDIPVEEIDSPLTKGVRGMSESIDETTEVKGQEPISQKWPRASNLRSPLLLIVEDNPDVSNYISSFMEKDYRIITAENGNIGLKKTLDKYPDLIISDVMMPEMDGFELCKKLKTDERISHIPVILLTAKADLDSKINGLEFGADDYVTKPFEARELQIRSKNLIEQRRKLREKFSALIDLNPEDISASSMDEQLLQRLLSVFEDHIEEPEFSTAELAREVGLSRMHLNRKLQSLTNLSTHDFIRTLRLQRAAKLLRNASGNVSEIAYKVGFNNLSHFSKAFRKHFGKLPSDFSGNEK